MTVRIASCPDEDIETSTGDCIKFECPKATVKAKGQKICLCQGRLVTPLGETLQGYFNSSINCPGGEKTCCIPCPIGGDCAHGNGLLVHQLIPQNGYWRFNRRSEIFADCADGYYSGDRRDLAKRRCRPLSSSIKANETELWTANQSAPLFQECKSGYHGPICRACDFKNDFVVIGNACVYCSGGSKLGAAIGTLVGLAATAFLLAFLVMNCLKAEKAQAVSKARDTGNRVLGQVKLLISFMQIMSSFPVTLNGVPWVSCDSPPFCL